MSTTISPVPGKVLLANPIIIDRIPCNKWPRVQVLLTATDNVHDLMKRVQISHRASGEVLADGPLGWGITPFEGNYYISRKYLKTDRFRVNFLPGLCFYKFLYVWMDLKLDHGQRIRNLAWMYWLPNPLLPFIWFRVAVSRLHPALQFEEY